MIEARQSSSTMSEVAVLMAAYNGLPYLPAAVESIRAQTLRDWTLVIVDDGSTDGSSDYLRGLDDPRIEIIEQANQGLGLALNRGLAACRAPLVARMDADDVAHPTRLAEQVDFMRRHPEVGLLGTQIQRLGSRRIGTASVLATRHRDIVRDLLDGKPAMYHPTVMFRTQLAHEIGGYWAKVLGEEWDFFLRMAERAELANLDRVLLSYRIHTGSLTGANMRQMRWSVAYAIDCACRRQAGEVSVAYDTWCASQAQLSFWRRATERVEMYARCQYRIALGELLGSHPWRGYARLGLSAACSPKLTSQRVWAVAAKWGTRVRQWSKPWTANTATTGGNS
ncbi:MAG: glycosyltransferase [Pirellulales bacterium]|nr:glycosyltransferase [Pirellulales bacterium]